MPSNKGDSCFQDGFCGFGIENTLGIDTKSRHRQRRERATVSEQKVSSTISSESR